MPKCVNAKPGSSKIQEHKCKLCELCYACHECPDSKIPLCQKKGNCKKKIPTNDIFNDEDIKNLLAGDRKPRYITVGPNNEIQDQTIARQSRVDTDSHHSHNPVVKPVLPTVHSCTKCDKTFESKHDLDIHDIYHSNESEHMCDICFSSFKYSYELIKHKINHKFPCFCCPFCKKEFPTEERCKLHTRKHTGEKLFTCDICERSFLENSQLKNHFMIHTDERPYGCDECGRAFRSKFYLSRHNWIHEGVKPFICHVCQKTFRHKCNLRTHLKKHNLSDDEEDRSDIFVEEELTA